MASKPGPVPAYQNVIAITAKEKEVKGWGKLYFRSRSAAIAAIATQTDAPPYRHTIAPLRRGRKIEVNNRFIVHLSKPVANDSAFRQNYSNRIFAIMPLSS